MPTYRKAYEVREFETLKYMLIYPDGYEKGKKYPVIFHLHGAGGRGMPVMEVLGHPVCTWTENMENFPFVIVYPVCHENTWFDLFETLSRFAVYVSQAEFCDPERLYVMGGSLGGYTTWQIAMSLPELFAAIVPICGGGMYWNAGRLVHMGVWAFHGDEDGCVYPEESKKMVDIIQSGGGSAKLTIYKNTNHNAWTPTFQDKNVWEGLLSHQVQYKQTRTEYDDVETYG